MSSLNSTWWRLPLTLSLTQLLTPTSPTPQTLDTLHPSLTTMSSPSPITSRHREVYKSISNLCRATPTLTRWAALQQLKGTSADARRTYDCVRQYCGKKYGSMSQDAALKHHCTLVGGDLSDASTASSSLPVAVAPPLPDSASSASCPTASSPPPSATTGQGSAITHTQLLAALDVQAARLRTEILADSHAQVASLLAEPITSIARLEADIRALRGEVSAIQVEIGELQSPPAAPPSSAASASPPLPRPPAHRPVLPNHDEVKQAMDIDEPTDVDGVELSLSPEPSPYSAAPTTPLSELSSRKDMYQACASMTALKPHRHLPNVGKLIHLIDSIASEKKKRGRPVPIEEVFRIHSVYILNDHPRGWLTHSLAAAAEAFAAEECGASRSSSPVLGSHSQDAG